MGAGEGAVMLVRKLNTKVERYNNPVEVSPVRWKDLNNLIETLTNGLTEDLSVAAAAIGTLNGTGAIKSTSPTAGIGYATGAGGAVTQITSATTAVVSNTISGQITTVALTNLAGVDHSFTLTNSAITSTDVVVVGTGTYEGTADGIPIVSVQSTSNGACIINVRNTGAVALDALVVINFAVIKAVAA